MLLPILPEGTGDYRSDIYHAYIDDKMEAWEKTLKIMNRIQDKSNDFLLIPFPWLIAAADRGTFADVFLSSRSF